MKQEAAPPEKASAIYYTIGEISVEYGVTPRTLRFYEQRGLLLPIRRGASRLYDATQRARFELILKCKMLGFTLVEIAEVLDARSDRAKRNEGLALDEKALLSRRQHAEKRRDELDQAIEELRAALERLSCSAS